MSQVARVTDTGQTTIPEDLREKYDLEPGDEVVWLDTDEGIVVKKRTRTGDAGCSCPTTPRAEKREEIAEELGHRIRDRRDRNYGNAWNGNVYRRCPLPSWLDGPPRRRNGGE